MTYIYNDNDVGQMSGTVHEGALLTYMNTHSHARTCILRYEVKTYIKVSAHETFLEWPSSDTLKIDRLESQIIWNSLRARKLKDLNKIANVG
jgi:hypothetical protein